MTGHQSMPDEARVHAAAALDDLLGRLDAPRGVTSLAVGADQLFARTLLRRGVAYDVVLPSRGYTTTFDGEDVAEYERLLARAEQVTTLPFPEPSEAAFLAAGIVVAERSDLVVAIWDGRPAVGLGGTGDVVAYCRSLGREVHVVWPDGVRR